MRRSQEEALDAENKANTAILQANSAKEKAVQKKSEYDKLIASQKKLTEKRAEQLNDQFRKQWQWVMLVLIAYSVLATLFTGYNSERVRSDCINAFNSVGNVIMTIFNDINSISEQISSSVGVPEFLVMIFVAIVVFGILGIIMFFVGRTVMNVYQKCCYDEISLFALLISVAVLVWFAEFMPLNIVLMLVLSHIVRWHSLVY